MGRSNILSSRRTLFLAISLLVAVAIASLGCHEQPAHQAEAAQGYTQLGASSPWDTGSLPLIQRRGPHQSALPAGVVTMASAVVDDQGNPLVPVKPIITAEDEDEDDEDKDYWESVKFGIEQFNEVRDFVKSYYIDASIDENRALAEAANFALLSIELEKPKDQPPLKVGETGKQDITRELLPVAFYDARKDLEDEEGRLDGKTYKLAEGDKFLIHILPPEKKKKRKKLSDEEIKELRDKHRARNKLLEDTWSEIAFSESDFMRVIKEIKSLKKKYPNIKMNKVWIAAAQGYLYSLDPHSSLLNKEAWDKSNKNIGDSSFDGIGAVLTQKVDGETIVESPIEGQPAVTAGLKAGDVIVKVDEWDIEGWELPKVVKKIRGPKGTTVKLTVRRVGEPDDLVIPITRAHIKIVNVEGDLIKHHGDIGYIKVSGFIELKGQGSDTTSDVKKKVEELTQKSKGGKLRGLIIDLRNDSGGLLDQAISLADMFLRSGIIVSVKNKVKWGLFSVKGDEEYKAHDDFVLTMPLVVLVNDSTASAAEIFASAIQENGRGIVVGDRTFGKASVQSLFSPEKGKGYFIKLTVARYYSPSGDTIQVVGVKPDIEIPEEVGKPMPLGFREEDLSHHLPPIQPDKLDENPNKELISKIKTCDEKRGIAEKIFQANPNPQIKFDYQLFKAADYLECLIDEWTTEPSEPADPPEDEAPGEGSDDTAYIPKLAA